MRNTKNLFIVTAAIESATGLALVVSPSLPISILFGSPLDSDVAVQVGRVAGAALLALSLACWLSRNDGNSIAGRSLVSAMLLYNILATGLLVYAGLGLGLSTVALWLTVPAHAALGVWTAGCLRPK